MSVQDFQSKKYSGVLRACRSCRNTCCTPLHDTFFLNLVISVNISGFNRTVGSHSKSGGITGWSSKWYSSSSQQLRWFTENIWKQRYKHGVRSEPEQCRWEVWRIISLPAGPIKPCRSEGKAGNKNTLISLGLQVASKESRKWVKFQYKLTNQIQAKLEMGDEMKGISSLCTFLKFQNLP